MGALKNRLRALEKHFLQTHSASQLSQAPPIVPQAPSLAQPSQPISASTTTATHTAASISGPGGVIGAEAFGEQAGRQVQEQGQRQGQCFKWFSPPSLPDQHSSGSVTEWVLPELHGEGNQAGDTAAGEGEGLAAATGGFAWHMAGKVYVHGACRLVGNAGQGGGEEGGGGGSEEEDKQAKVFSLAPVPATPAGPACQNSVAAFNIHTGTLRPSFTSLASHHQPMHSPSFIIFCYISFHFNCDCVCDWA